MKTLLTSLSIISMAFLVSCNESKKVEKPINNVEEPSSSCLAEDYPVLPLAAMLWEKSFETVFDSLFGGEVNHRIFNKDSLKKLQSLYGMSQIRAYYILKDSTVISQPDIALVNVDAQSCTDIYNHEGSTNDILVADPNGGTFHNSDTIKKWIQNWKDFMDPLADGVFIKVYGYNYKWATVWKSVIDTSMHPADTHKLIIRDALHVVSTENENYEPNSGPFSGTDIQGFLALDLILTNKKDSDVSLRSYDFSLPCPQLCGDLAQ